MATILINSAAYTGIIPSSGASTFYMFSSSGSSSSQATSFGANTPNIPCILNIYTGAIADFATFTNITQRASDLLVSFTTTAAKFAELTSTNSRRIQLAYFGSTPVNATQTGVATWFMLANQFSGGAINDLSIRSAILGSVGDTASGADLLIPSTSIVSGIGYKLNGFILNFPYTFTV